MDTPSKLQSSCHIIGWTDGYILIWIFKQRASLWPIYLSIISSRRKWRMLPLVQSQPRPSRKPYVQPFLTLLLRPLTQQPLRVKPQTHLLRQWLTMMPRSTFLPVRQSKLMFRSLTLTHGWEESSSTLLPTKRERLWRLHRVQRSNIRIRSRNSRSSSSNSSERRHIYRFTPKSRETVWQFGSMGSEKMHVSRLGRALGRRFRVALWTKQYFWPRFSNFQFWQHKKIRAMVIRYDI